MPNLTTLANVKEYVGIASADTNDDTFLTALIDAVEQVFINEVGWDILSGSSVLYRDDLSGTRFTFPYGPVTASTLARLTSLADDTWENVTAGTYRVRTEGRISWIEFPSGFQEGTSYRFTNTVGYASNAIPKDIIHCLNTAAAIEYAKSPKGGTGREWDHAKRSKNDKGIVETEEWMKDLPIWAKTVRTYTAR